MNIATYFPREANILRILLLMSATALGIGLFAPIITLTKLLVVENTFSIFAGVLQLVENGQYFLFVLIFGFSVMLPIGKLIILWRLVSGRQARERQRMRLLHWMHLYGKWSMLDVFVVAILVVAVKLGALVSVEMHYGLYAFASAVVLTMVVTARVVTLTDKIP